MTQTLMEKINKIELLLVEINSKIDNFLGFEEISEKEREEIKKIQEEIKKGIYSDFNDVFGDSQ